MNTNKTPSNRLNVRGVRIMRKVATLLERRPAAYDFMRWRRTSRHAPLRPRASRACLLAWAGHYARIQPPRHDGPNNEHLSDVAREFGFADSIAFYSAIDDVAANPIEAEWMDSAVEAAKRLRRLIRRGARK